MGIGNNQISLSNELGFMNSVKNYIDILLELGKVRITFFVAFSTSIGFILYAEGIYSQMILPALGVFILACGSSALNHFQERDLDALMERTKSRPIPSGRISNEHTLLVSLIMILTGAGLIYLSSNTTALFIGLITLFWYNVIYTPLKRRYALAVVPGSLIGALPPMIGYVAAGGSPFDYQILSLALFFFIWQIPHFWLLLLIYGKDYENAGFPSLTKIFSTNQLSRITYIWIAALVTSGLLIPLFSTSIISLAAILILGFWLLIDTKGILSNYMDKLLFRKAFLSVNIYVLVIVIILSIDKLFLKEISRF